MKRIITVITLCAALMGSEIAMASSEYSYKNRKYESPKIDITITGFEKGKDYEDSPTINVFFTLKNKTKKSIELEDTFTDYVEVWQNGSYLEPAVIDEGPHQKKYDLLEKKVKPKKTVKSVYSYYVEDESKPIEIRFSEGDYYFDDDEYLVGKEEILVTKDDKAPVEKKKKQNEKKVKSSNKNSSGKISTSTSNKTSKSEKSAFKPKDVSDSTIESISTYDDYLTMFNFIVENYLSEYESAIEGTVLHDPAAFEEQKKQYDEAIKQQKEEYGEMGNKKIVGKSTLVDYLKTYRDSLNDHVKNLKDSLDKG